MLGCTSFIIIRSDVCLRALFGLLTVLLAVYCLLLRLSAPAPYVSCADMRLLLRLAACCLASHAYGGAVAKYSLGPFSSIYGHLISADISADPTLINLLATPHRGPVENNTLLKHTNKIHRPEKSPDDYTDGSCVGEAKGVIYTGVVSTSSDSCSTSGNSVRVQAD